MAKGGARPGAGRKPGRLTKKEREVKKLIELDIKEHCIRHVEAAVKVWVDILNDKTCDWETRMKAADRIIDRVYGKAAQKIEGDMKMTLAQIIAKSQEDDGQSGSSS